MDLFLNLIETHTWLTLAIAVIFVIVILTIPKRKRKRVKQQDYPLLIEGMIIRSIEDDKKGDKHQRLIIQIRKVIENERRVPVKIGDELFVVIRYGDKNGFPRRLSFLDHAVGEHLKIRGRYVPKMKSDHSNRRPVFHFTHKPVGYIIYKGKKYE